MSTTTTTIRVVLADDHTVVRTGLRAVPGTARDIDVVAEAASGEEAVQFTAHFALRVGLTGEYDRLRDGRQ